MTPRLETFDKISPMTAPDKKGIFLGKILILCSFA